MPGFAEVCLDTVRKLKESEAFGFGSGMVTFDASRGFNCYLIDLIMDAPLIEIRPFPFLCLRLSPSLSYPHPSHVVGSLHAKTMLNGSF